MKKSLFFVAVILCEAFVPPANYASEAIAGSSDPSISQFSDMGLVELWGKAEPTLRMNDDLSTRQFFKNTPLFASPATYAFVRRIIGKKITDSSELEFDIGEKNVARAIDAVLGSTAPQSHLLAGLLLLRGAPGLAPNPTEGFARLKQCNETSPSYPDVQRDAQFEIGIALASGHGVERNEEEGLRWIRRAAEKGHEPARDFLRMRGEEPPSVAVAVRPVPKPTPMSTPDRSPSNDSEWKTFNLPENVTIRLPKSWTILSDTQKSSIGDEAGKNLGVNSSGPVFAANFYETNGNTLALLNVRFYDDIDVSREEAAGVTDSDVTDLDNALRAQLTSSLAALGQTLKQWKGTKKTVIGGVPCFVTEYIRSAENDPLGKCVKLVRFFDGPKSFTLTVSHSMSEEAWLRPLCDRIIFSIKPAPLAPPQEVVRKTPIFFQPKSKASEQLNLWPLLVAFTAGISALVFVAWVLSRQGQAPVAIFKAFVKCHPWIFAFMLVAVLLDASGIFAAFGMSFAIPSVSLVSYMLGGAALFRFALARRPMGKLAGWLVPIVLYMGWVFIYAAATLRPYGPASFLMLMCCLAIYRVVQLKTDTGTSDQPATI